MALISLAHTLTFLSEREGNQRNGYTTVSSLIGHSLIRSITMASIPIQNETDYTLTDDMMQHIIRDAQEHFGEEVRSIRVQSGLERHAFNARTHEVRYAFSPQDFGFGHTMPITPEPRTSEQPRARRRSSRSDAETEAAIIPVPFESVDGDEDVEEDTEPLETSLESLDEGQDDNEEEEDDFFKLDDPVEDADEDDEDNVLEDDEDDED
jgi:hypothetical protein